jgi:hypothetical protein
MNEARSPDDMMRKLSARIAFFKTIPYILPDLLGI